VVRQGRVLEPEGGGMGMRINNPANPIVWVVIFFFGVFVVLVTLIDEIFLGWLLDPSYRRKGK